MAVFKKFGKAVFGVEFNKKEQEIIDKAITELVLERFQKFEKDLDASVLWMLHVNYGFGKDRLKDVWKNTYQQNDLLRKHYEIDPSDACWMCTKLLKEYGCDLDQWYKEEGY